MGFKTHSELNSILPEKKKLTVVRTDEPEVAEVEESEANGEISVKEYDYLLSM